MTTDIETTTMGTVARWMWVLSLDENQLEDGERWEDVPDREKSDWHRKAVTIIDAAAPVWEKRVRQARNRMVWDEAVAAVQEQINANVPITAETVLVIENPYA